MKRLVLIYLALWIVHFAGAQSLVSCVSYDEDGNPEDINKSWEIKPGGSFVYLHYSDSKVLSEQKGKWLMQIDYQPNSSAEYSAYSTVNMEPENGKNWCVVDQKFDKAGFFRAKVTLDGREMASWMLTIEMQEHSDDPNNASYYKESVLIFCDSVGEEAQMEGVSDTFSLIGKESRKLAVLVTNGQKPFARNSVQYVLYKSDDKENVIDEGKLGIQAEWNYITFETYLYAPGEYVLDLYTDEDVFICSASVTIIE
jgi:hypothetical protein